jgi:hypothetical protein
VHPVKTRFEGGCIEWLHGPKGGCKRSPRRRSHCSSCRILALYTFILNLLLYCRLRNVIMYCMWADIVRPVC